MITLNIPIYFYFLTLFFLQSNFNSFLLAQNLNKKHLNEVKELILLIDMIDNNLKRSWNLSNDYGVRNQNDYNYAENVLNVTQQINQRLLKLPKGNYQEYLKISLKAYLDVGLMRLLVGEDDGFDKQTEIATLYQIQDSEPHLWAWRIWQIARFARNKAAKELNLPLIDYSED